jgi:hypothetical protein
MTPEQTEISRGAQGELTDFERLKGCASVGSDTGEAMRMTTGPIRMT